MTHVNSCSVNADHRQWGQPGVTEAAVSVSFGCNIYITTGALKTSKPHPHRAALYTYRPHRAALYTYALTEPPCTPTALTEPTETEGLEKTETNLQS
ncbi:hypothetical protein PoB_004615400 [Plakobranchus ocellatus]|uniref:Uncharacterized protein n=1 Tax=Plakobranchus ocellatus TaxID=259542 RepID=A0AAV4BMT4_9GAST|nr:hypothetical protein PoB_004615400 [Plakobranchus ocellatus]